MWKNLSKNEAERIFDSWNKKPTELKKMSVDYNLFRKELLEAFKCTLEILKIEENQIKQNAYNFDLVFALKIYRIFLNRNFTERLASDLGVWRYISINVIPDITYERWGLNPQRFYANPNRLWIKTLWWYVYLSWQGDYETTYQVLKNNSTDELVQLVERTGANGYRVELYREIMNYYGCLPSRQKNSGSKLFRKVMKLNTARTQVVEPSLVQGGEKGYVKELFDYFEPNDH